MMETLNGYSETRCKNNNYMSNKEIVQYYGQIWENVKHMKSYVKELKQRYIKETQS
jgi:hypothetical protein